MSKIKPIFWVYVMTALLTLHVSIPIFINSTYLSSFITEGAVGLVYSIGSIITILALVVTSKALEKFGNYKTALTLIIFGILSLIGLAVFSNIIFIMLAFLAHFVLSTLIGFNNDIFLESYSRDSTTGEIRGINATLANISWLIGPIIAGFLLADTTNYWLIYLVAMLFLAPALLVLTKTLKGFKDAHYHHMSFIKDMKAVIKNKDERYIFLSGFMLKLFFAWMVIYTPIYLNQYLGFDFKQIGFMFAAMMAAYIIFEWPLGRLADKSIGEKEILAAGFVVIVIATAFLSFIPVASAIIWTIALFLTRVGAAMVEVTTESYFFKKITSVDTDDISFWRMLRPVGYLIAPLVMTPFLLFFDFRYIFVAMAIAMLLGVVFALQIKDTK